MSLPGMEEVDELLDPSIPIPDEVAPSMTDILPRGYLSVSQAVLVLKCAHAWELRYVDGKMPRTNARPFQGIVVHRAAESSLRGKLLYGEVPRLDEVTDLFSTEFDKVKPLIEDWEGEDPDRVKDTGVTCTKIFHQEVATKAMPVMVEKTFHTTIRTSDGKVRLPVLGRIDSIQVQALNEKEYQDNIRPRAAESVLRQEKAGVKMPVLESVSSKPLRIHDLKVVTDKWSESDLDNDLQFGLYSGVEHIPDVQVDQIVKGRAKVPRPRYEQLSGVMTPKAVQHSVRVLEGVAKTIGLGHFPMTDPSNWWCSEKFCSMWHHCRGAK